MITSLLCHPNSGLGGSENIQLLLDSSGQQVTWCPMVVCSVYIRAQQHFKSCFTDDVYLLSAHSMTLPHDIRNFHCKAIFRVCQRLHMSSLLFCYKPQITSRIMESTGSLDIMVRTAYGGHKVISFSASHLQLETFHIT